MGEEPPERERMSEVKKVSGVFTGSYAVNPFNGKRIPIWVSDYVLMGYGTGAIMAVPAHDSRDFAFARHFQLPIIQVVAKPDESRPTLQHGPSRSTRKKECLSIPSSSTASP